MKKKLFLITILGALLLGVGGAKATLWDFYNSQGLELPSVEARVPLAAECGIENYKGTFDQNVLLESCLRSGDFLEPIYNVFNDFRGDFLGASVPKRPTEFKTSLNEQKTEGHSGTTLKVSSVTTKDGNTLDTSVMGDIIVLSINPGASNSETVVCTALATSTKTFSGCTFGYRFDNPTETQASNIKAHSPGEPVIISNSDTYLSQQYVSTDGDATLAGSLTFTGTNSFSGINTFSQDVRFATGSIFIGDNTTAKDKYVYVRNGDANSPFLFYDESENKWLVSNDGINTVDFSSSTSSGLSASTTRGIGITNSLIHINASTTKGLAFGVDGYLYQITSSTGNISSNSNGLYLDGTDALIWTGYQTFNSLYSPSSTLTSVTSTNASITNLTLGGQNANSLVDGSTTSLHYHFLNASASDVLKTSSDTEVSTTSVSYVLAKQMRINMEGVFRVKFNLKISDDTPGTVNGRIYKNGVAYGTEFSTTSINYQTNTEDLTFEEGDTLDLYIKTEAGHSVFVNNLRVYFDINNTSWIDNLID